MKEGVEVIPIQCFKSSASIRSYRNKLRFYLSNFWDSAECRGGLPTTCFRTAGTTPLTYSKPKIHGEYRVCQSGLSPILDIA